MNPQQQRRVEEFGRGPFTVIVVEDADRAQEFAFDEAARVVERIPLAALHVLYLMKRSTPLTDMESVGIGLRADASARAAALGVNDRLMAVHLRAGDVVAEIAQLARELSADLVVVSGPERFRLGGLLKRKTLDQLHVELACPLVVALPTTNPTPQIATGCASCAMIRATSHGATWWCGEHAKHHSRAHRYGYSREHALAEHDSNVIPTGITFG